jgi:hypothetical protein
LAPPRSAATSTGGTRRVYSRLFLARLLLVLDSCQDLHEEIVQAVGSPEQWGAQDHEALLAG